MRIMFRRIVSLIKKDFLIETSYKLSFLMNIFSVLAVIVTYYFIDKLFGNRIASHLQEFGVNYFSYVLLSMAFFSYIGVGMGSFANRVRIEQVQGTLEALFLTPTKAGIIILSLGLWNIIFATFDLLIYIILGSTVFGIDFSNINFLASFVIVVLTIVSFSSLGVISAGFIILFKQGNPVGWVINTLEGLLGGVYFPVAVMPKWLAKISYCLPITYAIRGLELSVYKGYSLYDLKTEVSILFMFCIVFVPLSTSFFNYAVKKSRMQATLCQY